jgi:predicted nuclease with TOPRIM domain
MSEHNAEVLDFLRVRFNRIDERLDRISDDITDLKHRMTTLEMQVGNIPATEQLHYVSLSTRIDRMGERLDRIEVRLGLADA